MTEPCSAIVARFQYRYEAELARGYLADAGIPSAVQVDDAGGAYAGLQLTPSPARVHVRSEDLRRARRVLVDAGMTESSSPGPPTDAS